MASTNKLLLKSCQYLYNNRNSSGNQIMTSEDLNKCVNMFQNDFSSLDKNVQKQVLDNTTVDIYDPNNGLYERCKNQKDRDACLNTLLKTEMNEFEKKLGMGRRQIDVNESLNEYNNIQTYFNDNVKNIQRYKNKYQNSAEGSDDRTNSLQNLKREIKVLYDNHDRINSAIADYKQKIIAEYKTKNDSQFNDLINNYKMIEVNNKIIDRLDDNNSYKKEKNRINSLKYKKNNTIFKVLLVIMIILLIINPVLIFIYYKL